MTIDKILAAPSRAIKLCGTDALDPPTRTLSAGKLSVEAELNLDAYPVARVEAEK